MARVFKLPQRFLPKKIAGKFIIVANYPEASTLEIAISYYADAAIRDKTKGRGSPFYLERVWPIKEKLLWLFR